MMNSRGWIVIVFVSALFLGLLLGARYGYSQGADTSPTSLCQQARETVAAIGREEAEKMARALGATDEQIALAKECLRNRHHTTHR
jgi:hypothetical protein